MISQTIDLTTLIVVIVIFTVTFICSGIVTYKLRMKKSKKEMPDNKENDGKNS